VLSHQSAAAIWGFGQRDRVVHVTVEGDRARSRPGVRVHRTASLNAAVHNGLPLTTPARTLQKRLKALCKAARLPMPRMNARVAGWEVDAFWPAHDLVVEVDGYDYHSTRQAFERDRRKDAALTTAGYRVVRVTGRRLRYEAYAVSAQLGALLSVRPA
jgi:very-short-patch-repair endonuclease